MKIIVKMKKIMLMKILGSLASFFIIGTFWYRIPIAVRQLSNDSNFIVLTVFIYYSIRNTLVVSLPLLMYKIWFTKKHKYNSSINLIYLLIVFVIWSYPIGYGILSFGKQLSSIKGIAIGSPDGWLAFTGSVIGGSITLIALVLTLQYENNKTSRENQFRAEEAEYQNPPIISYKLDDNLYIKGSSNSLYREYTEESEMGQTDFINFYIYGKLSNISGASITNIQIQDIKLFKYQKYIDGQYQGRETKTEIPIQLKLIHEISIDDILPGSLSKTLNLKFKIPSEFLIKPKASDETHIILTMDCIYTSVITNNKKKYRSEIEFYLRDHDKKTESDGKFYYKRSIRIVRIDDIHKISR